MILHRKGTGMKLNKDFLTHNMSEDYYLVPVGGTDFSGIVKGNKTMGIIIELLKNETTENQIISAMTARFDAPKEVLKRDVEKILVELRKIGALDE